VEIVRRTARELFQHELVIGNFSGKYFVIIRGRRFLPGNTGMVRAKTPDGRVFVRPSGSKPLYAAAAVILLNS
jgi:hypothetical protein